MKKFADFGINTLNDKTVFAVPQVSITEVFNCEIAVLDFEKDVKTRHGEGRYVVKFLKDNIEQKFFTNAAPIKEALDKVNKQDFPFTTTIKQQRFGSGSVKTFYFT